MRLADYMMLRLEEVGVRHVFLVTGRGALFLTDALAKNSNLMPVCNHHEQASAFAAVGYAEQTGGLGACLVSTGCASTNTITGVLSAWQDSVPCIFISGQNVLKETTMHTGIPVRSYGQQEADIVSIVKPITKFAKMIESADEIFDVMDEALSSAMSGRRGPVWIDVPLDLQSATVDPTSRTQAAMKSPKGVQASQAEIHAVAADLAAAKRPVLFLGGEVKGSPAIDQIQKLVHSWNIPVVFDGSAPDIYGSANRLSIGSVGSMGCSRAGSFAVQNADLILVLGSRLTSIITGPDFCKFARDAKVIAVDVDSSEHQKESIKIDRFIISEIPVFLAQINQFPARACDASWAAKCLHWKRIFGSVEPQFHCEDRVDLYQLAEVLGRVLPKQSTLVTDSGLIEVILPTNIPFSPEMNCIHPFSQGAMGFAIPAAIGAACGKSHTVVAVVGDGSIMMNLQELETIRHNKLPIKILVINNNAYSIIRRRQRDLFRKRIIGTDPSNGVSCPDFAKVAECFGFHYSQIQKPADLEEKLRVVLDSPVFELCEIMGRENQEYIEVGHARTSKDNRFVRRPLEDQMPFLDRELFLSEMLVQPIDQ
jgi:acetolactate synthase-1/2/3 large subunit